MVGAVSPRLRRQLASVMIAVALHDTDQLVDALLELEFTAGPIDRARFGAELERLLARTYEAPLGEIALAPLFHSMSCWPCYSGTSCDCHPISACSSRRCS